MEKDYFFKSNKKKAQLSGITWFVAIVIIFFILLVFVFVSSGLAARKQISIREVFTIEKLETKSYITQSNFISFLASYVEVNGEKRTVAEVISLFYSENKNIDEIQTEFANFSNPLQDITDPQYPFKPYCFDLGEAFFYRFYYLLPPIYKNRETYYAPDDDIIGMDIDSGSNDLVAFQPLLKSDGVILLELYKVTGLPRGNVFGQDCKPFYLNRNSIPYLE